MSDLFGNHIVGFLTRRLICLFALQAKLLEEMDAEFGIGSLVEEEFKPKEKVKHTDEWIFPSLSFE